MLLKTDNYKVGDLILIDDSKGFVEMVILLELNTTGVPHGSIKFYKVFSITHGVSYTIPETLIKGLLCI